MSCGPFIYLLLLLVNVNAIIWSSDMQYNISSWDKKGSFTILSSNASECPTNTNTCWQLNGPNTEIYRYFSVNMNQIILQFNILLSNFTRIDEYCGVQISHQHNSSWVELTKYDMNHDNIRQVNQSFNVLNINATTINTTIIGIKFLIQSVDSLQSCKINGIHLIEVQHRMFDIDSMYRPCLLFLHFHFCALFYFLVIYHHSDRCNGSKSYRNKNWTCPNCPNSPNISIQF